MKLFYLIRHAKSSWGDPMLKDFDRPLNDRGHQAAKDMSALFVEKQPIPELIVSSPAMRAITTAKYFAAKMGKMEAEIVKNEAIYEAFPEAILHIIRTTSNDVNAVAFFGHNPAFTEVSNYFSDTYIDNVPTCGVLCFESHAETWLEVANTNTKLVAHYFPKIHLQ